MRESYGQFRLPKLDTQPGPAAMYSLVSVGDDYLVANPFKADGQTINTAKTVYIAKPWTLRRKAFDGKTVGGISYTYSSNTQRTATQGSTTETQLITPDYDAGDVIYAIESTSIVGIVVSGAGRNIDLVDLNVDARAWAAQ